MSEPSCPVCKHMPHSTLGFCPNMASDNDCDCPGPPDPMTAAVPDPTLEGDSHTLRCSGLSEAERIAAGRISTADRSAEDYSAGWDAALDAAANEAERWIDDHSDDDARQELADWLRGMQGRGRLAAQSAAMEALADDLMAEIESKANERETWPRCTRTLLGVCNDGRMEPWWGTDGHNGRERFYTCDRCGRTS